MEIDSAAAVRAAGLFGGVVWDCLLLYDVLFDGVRIWVREVKRSEKTNNPEKLASSFSGLNFVARGGLEHHIAIIRH